MTNPRKPEVGQEPNGSVPTDSADIPALLKSAREDAGLTQDDVAQRMGIKGQTVSRWELGKRTPSRGDVALFLAVCGRGSELGQRISQTAPRGTIGDEAWSPNPALKKAIPPRAHEVAMGHCRRLVAAGLPREEVEALERILIDSRYAKANARLGRELTEDDWILLVDDAWDAIRETLGFRGVRV